MSDQRPHRRRSPSAPRRLGESVLRGALLGNFHDAGVAITRCAAGRDKETLFAYPALREKVLECLEVMRNSARDMPTEDKAEMSAIDWAAWETLDVSLSGSSRDWRDRLWSVIDQDLAATLLEARRYRGSLPVWFGAAAVDGE